MRNRPLLPLALLAALHTAVPREAWAFKLKTHVYTANIAMADVVDGSAYLPGMVSLHRIDPAIVAPGALADPRASLAEICARMSSIDCARLTGREIPIVNPDLQLAIVRYPRLVRAGTIGPDGYPDLIWGQQGAHVNHRRHEDGEPTPLRDALGGANQGDIYSGHAIPGHRDLADPYTWRSIDHGMYLLWKALHLNEGSQPGTWKHEQRLQALAFAYGFLLHISGAANAPSFVNLLAGSAFSVTAGHGLFGPVTEEIKHIVVEGYLDTHFTPAVFADPAHVRDPASNDPRVPGDNAVVKPILTALPAAPPCPAPPPSRWQYCNDLAGDGVANGSCSSRPENPFAESGCDPWQRVCFSRAEAQAAADRIRDQLVACPPRAACAPPSANPEGDLCNLADKLPSLKVLPTTCNPARIRNQAGPDGENELSNECIDLNCAHFPDRCPYEGIHGFSDREAQPIECESDATRFTTEAGLQGFLTDTRLDAPVHFLNKVLVEDPNPRNRYADPGDEPATSQPDRVRPRGLAGPHIGALLDLRDWLRKHSKKLEGFTLDPREWLADATCTVSFGLFCPDVDPIPLLTPSVFLGNRATLVNEQVYRWFELSTCVAQNLVLGATKAHPPDGGARIPDSEDACLRYPWYGARLQDQVRRALAATIGQPPSTGPGLVERCLGGQSERAAQPSPQSERDHAAVLVNLGKMKTFFIDDTIGRVFSINASDLGLPRGMRVVFDAVMSFLGDYLGAPIKRFFLDHAGRICREYVGEHFPEAEDVYQSLQALGAVAEARRPDALVNAAFLIDDLQADPAYAARIGAMLTPPQAADLQRLLENPSRPSNAAIARSLTAALLRVEAFVTLEGPRLRALRRLLAMAGPESTIVVKRVQALFNTIQLNKLAAFGAGGVRALEEAANRIPDEALPAAAFDRGKADLVHALRAGDKKMIRTCNFGPVWPR